MQKNKIANDYHADALQTTRPQPLSDKKIIGLINEIMSTKIDFDASNEVYETFKKEVTSWILSSKLNKLTGLEAFSRVDICIGCTQFIDTIYMKGPVQTLSGDYTYHQRLNPDIKFSEPGSLIPNVDLIIAMPFPSIGGIHPLMEEILDECQLKNISVHIDGAWVSCCRDIIFDFTHPAIKSIAISLSKGTGLGWNRIGLRWTHESEPDAISLMNDFHMNNKVLVIIGLHFIRRLSIDHLWLTHSDRYYKICNDFNLTPTNSIYIALQNGHPVGLSPLIKYLEEYDN